MGGGGPHKQKKHSHAFLVLIQLQPVDMVPNGPLKSHTRRARIDKLYSYFGDWRVLADEAVADAAPLPSFRPPPSTMAGGLSLISSIFATRFKDDDYMMAGLRRCFVSVGLAPGADRTYAVYTTHDRTKTKAINSRDGSCNGIERQRLA